MNIDRSKFIFLLITGSLMLHSSLACNPSWAPQIALAARQQATADFRNSDDAYAALLQGKDALNNRYDWPAAITWFSRANELYQREPVTEDTRQKRAQALVGLAFSYHNVGKNTLRDMHMTEVQEMLCIPESPDAFIDRAQFTEAASGYFLVDGYRYYIRYEQCQRASGTIDEQERQLRSAQRCFHKTLEIARVHNDTPEITTHAYQGLGTTFEFLSQCQIDRGNRKIAEQYSRKAITAFTHALSLRQQLLGDTHLHVARSCHKLARNYVKLAGILNGAQYQELYAQADSYYRQAFDIFQYNGMSPLHPKYKELLDEYAAFQKKELAPL